jgi:hypothetical protein
MFVLSFPLGRWLASLSGGRRYNITLIVGMALVSVYVGYFGAGGGFLVMALLGFCGVHNIHEMNALKVLTAAVSIGIPSVTSSPPAAWSGASASSWRFSPRSEATSVPITAARSTSAPCAGPSP